MSWLLKWLSHLYIISLLQAEVKFWETSAESSIAYSLFYVFQLLIKLFGSLEVTDFMLSERREEVQPFLLNYMCIC